MRFYSKWQILRINGLRTAHGGRHRQEGPRRGPPRGGEQDAFWSEMHRDAMELALDIHGAESLLVTAGPESWPGVARQKGRPGYPVTPMVSSFFFSRSETIWGGTAEIQRNIIGERALGLPKEPRPA
jgi:alkylation response protein AidB-like acyl-CoA dehydrogenase